MCVPEDETAAAAAGRGYLRASDADRERTVVTLKAAFVQGRLAKEEFDARVSQALAARTHAQLSSLSADLPVRVAAAAAPRKAPGSAARWCASGSLTPAILAVGFAVVAQPRDGGYGALVFAIAFIYFIRWLAAGADMLWEWHCLATPGAAICVRCAHSAPSHRTPGSCAVRQGALAGRSRCACTGYVPPGVSPQSADLYLQSP